MAPMAVPVPMKEYGTFAATRSLRDAEGLADPEDARRQPAPGARRSIACAGTASRSRKSPSDAQLAVERFSIAELTKAPRPFQGHQEARLKGAFDKAQLTVDAGSLFIPANQPLARLAFYLIEPESDDGLVTWNVIDEGLAVGQTYPIYRVVDSRAVVIKAQ